MEHEFEEADLLDISDEMLFLAEFIQHDLGDAAGMIQQMSLGQFADEPVIFIVLFNPDFCEVVFAVLSETGYPVVKTSPTTMMVTGWAQC